MALRLRIAVSAAAILWPVAAGAQATKPVASAPALDEPPRAEPLARYVPAEAGFYLRLSNRAEWATLLQSWSPEKSQDPLAALPVDGSALLDQLEDGTLVIAARSWRQRFQALTYCKPADPTRFARLLRQSEAETMIAVGDATAYRLSKNLWGATNNEVFVLNEIGPELDLFQSTIRLLGGEKLPALQDEAQFQTQLCRPDKRSSAVLFLREEATPDSQRNRPRWLPEWSSVCAAVNLAPGHLECRLWGQRKDPVPPQASTIDPRQLHLLPASTVAALTRRLTSESLLTALSVYSSRNRNAFSWQFVWAVEDADTSGLLTLTDIGPRGTLCVLASSDAATPRGAVIIESRHAGDTAQALADLFQQVAERMLALEPQPYQSVRVQPEPYKEHTLYNLDIHWSGDAVGVWSFLHFLKPCFCAVDGNLLMASDPSVVREMIDAAQSPGYAVPVLAQWAAPASSQDDTAARGFIDPGRLATHLKPLETLLASTDDNVIHWDWFQDLREYFNATPMQLGARLAKDDPDDPGKVKVLSVLEGRPADGKLKPGDFILAVDGNPLALENTREDLRRKLEAMPAGGPRRLRVERHGKMHEVVIDLPKPSSKSFRGLLTDTATAVEYLRRLGGHVQRVTYRQAGGDADVFGAEIVFELIASPAGHSATDKTAPR